MRTEKEIKERIKDLYRMKAKDAKNEDLYNGWIDALEYVLEEQENE